MSHFNAEGVEKRRLKKRSLKAATTISVTLCLCVLVVNSAFAQSGRQMLHGHVPKAIARLHLQSVGLLTNTARLNLAISLPLRNPAALDDLLRQIQDPTSTNYHRYLTPGQFAAQFGPSEQDYQAVIAWARTNGFAVNARHGSRLVVDVNGAVPDINRTFGVTLRTYQHPIEHRTFYAPDTDPSANLPVSILHIGGLDNYSRMRANLTIQPITNGITTPLPSPLPAGRGEGEDGRLSAGTVMRNLKVAATTNNAIPNAGSGPGGTYRGTDFRAAYAPNVTLTGLGQKIGLLEYDGYYVNDITNYEGQAGLPAVTLINVAVNGGVSSPGVNNMEVALDIEMAISMAPGASQIIVYEAPNGSTSWETILSQMADDDLAAQLSCSWFDMSLGAPDLSSEAIFKQMAAQGQSFFCSSGDSDAFINGIPFPEESTNVTQVGGTALTTTGAGGTYVSETVWNAGGGEGSSGGTSTNFSIPIWQRTISMTTNHGSTTMRNTPDVALTASNIYVVYNNGSSGNASGTSASAPLWAGFMALVNEQAAIGGHPAIGFANPAIYAICTNGNYSADFHDIITGSNTWSASLTNYQAVPGYDLCTGWGTPAGQSLIDDLAGPLLESVSSVTNPNSATIIIIVPPTGTNGEWIAVQGSTYTWTTSPTGAGQIQSTNSAAQSATNLFTALTNDFPSSLRFKFNGSTNFTISTYLRGVLSVSNSPGWMRVAINTNVVAGGNLTVSNFMAQTITLLDNTNGPNTRTNWW
jgi:subtilase family serine protease